jgi:hypothetical protein
VGSSRISSAAFSDTDVSSPESEISTCAASIRIRFGPASGAMTAGAAPRCGFRSMSGSARMTPPQVSCGAADSAWHNSDDGSKVIGRLTRHQFRTGTRGSPSFCNAHQRSQDA